MKTKICRMKLTAKMHLLFIQLIKVDADNKKVRTWNEENVYPSEPIFVPTPNAKVNHSTLLI